MAGMLDTRQLQAFLSVAREGGFTRAAESLHLTQSAVSHSIRALEQDLGCRLFYKVGKRNHLSRQGLRLLRHADAIDQEMARARKSLGALDEHERGEIRLGSS